MSFPHQRFRQALLVCVLIIAGLGGVFALVMLLGAITGKGFAGSILLGGFGLLLLFVFIFIFALVVMYLKSRHDEKDR